MKYLLTGLLAISFVATGCVERRTAEKPPAVAIIPAVTTYTTNSPGTKYALLPSSVQRTITTQAGTAEIKDINKVTGSSREVYEIKFRDPALNPTLYVAEDGTLISSGTYSYSGAPGAFSGTDEGSNLSMLKGLPYPVQRAVTEQGPKASIVDVQKSRHIIYEITFKDPNLNPKMLVTDEGVILRPSQ
jgi:hypothetical protein